MAVHLFALYWSVVGTENGGLVCASSVRHFAFTGIKYLLAVQFWYKIVERSSILFSTLPRPLLQQYAFSAPFTFTAVKFVLAVLF